MKMTKRELKALAYGIGISEAHEERRIVAASQSKQMMEFLKSADCRNGESVFLIKAFNAGVAAEISQQTMQEL